MDYEKKYNEALEDMRVIYPNLKGDAKLAVEHAFPELAESEDERIRKGIVETIKQCPDTFLNPKNRDEMLAYLEKQKEQKPAWSEEDKQWLSEVYFAIDHSMYSEDERQAMKKYIDSLRSQSKPTEWSEEDENKIESIKGLITTGRFADTNTIRTIWELLDSLRPQPQWKPSEEQIYSLGTVVKGAGDVSVGSVGYNLKSLYEQLKSL